MCVILELEKGVEFPFEKLEVACEINPDGFGLLVQDRGKMECIKLYDPKGNNPDMVMKHLEDAKDHHRLLHLRFSTAGQKTVENCHPFQVLNKTDHGVDLWFMHNGTLYDFTKAQDAHSDSYHFNESVLKPLLASLRYTHGPTYLEQEYLKYLLKEVAGNSVFTLFDSHDNLLKIENNSCIKAEGMWASNSYSFQTTHTRYKSTYTPYNQQGGQCALPFHSTTTGQTHSSGTSLGKTLPSTTNSGTKTSVPTTTSSTAASTDYTDGTIVIDSSPVVHKTLALEAEHLKELLQEALLNRKPGTTTNISFVGFRKPSFLELTGLDSWQDLKYLDQETIEEMVELLPDLASTLISDLLFLILSETSEFNRNKKVA